VKAQGLLAAEETEKLATNGDESSKVASPVASQTREMPQLANNEKERPP